MPPPIEVRISAKAAAHHQPREAARLAHAAVDDQQQPGQRRVPEQGDAGAAREDHGVRVEHVEGGRDQVGDPPRAPHEGVQQPQHPPGRDREDQAEPDALRDPRAQPDSVQQREDRPHRPEVAAVLGSVDRPEVDRVGPDRGHLAQEGARIDVQVDLRVARRPARSLREREGKRGDDEPGRHGAVAGGSAHGRCRVQLRARDHGRCAATVLRRARAARTVARLLARAAGDRRRGGGDSGRLHPRRGPLAAPRAGRRVLLQRAAEAARGRPRVHRAVQVRVRPRVGGHRRAPAALLGPAGRARAARAGLARFPAPGRVACSAR